MDRHKYVLSTATLAGVSVGQLLRNEDREGRVFGRILSLRPRSDGWTIVWVNRDDVTDPAP